ncbi:MAG: PD-(D/E)XK nuclease family transposase [Lachnospiraceae bacterium]|nr:PD-(D/E)XK nuclease family transposase [Lachnospiraceae bacterium]
MNKFQNRKSDGLFFDEAEKEQQHKEDLQRIRDFRLIDDDFMNAVFDENIEGTELLLRIILGKSELIVSSVKTQKVMKNLTGRDIWLDIDASDDTGKEYNLEIQRADKGADRKRARYHSSIKDAHFLKPGDDFEKLPESYVIFITENDVMKGGLPLYQVERVVTNNSEPFNDGEHIIYVNGEDKNSATELGKLMHDFYCTDPDDMYYKQLADKVRYFKENEEGVRSMCASLEKMRDETAQKAAEQTKIQMALKMIKDGKLSLDQISEYSMLTIDRVKELATLRTV